VLGSRSPNTVQCSRIWGLGVRLGADFEPVVEVVGHVVAAEGEHGPIGSKRSVHSWLAWY